MIDNRRSPEYTETKETLLVPRTGISHYDNGMKVGGFKPRTLLVTVLMKTVYSILISNQLG
jgi:hypothetical protein